MTAKQPPKPRRRSIWVNLHLEIGDSTPGELGLQFNVGKVATAQLNVSSEVPVEHIADMLIREIGRDLQRGQAGDARRKLASALEEMLGAKP